MAELVVFRTRISLARSSINALRTKVQTIDQPSEFPTTASECTIFVTRKLGEIEEVEMFLTDLLEYLRSQIEAAITYIVAREEQSERELLMNDLDDFLKTKAYQVEITTTRWTSRLKHRNRELERQSRLNQMPPGTSATASARGSSTIGSTSSKRNIKEAQKHDRNEDAIFHSTHRQDWAPGKLPQNTVVLNAPPQDKVELNLVESFNINACNGEPDTFSLDNDVEDNEVNALPEMTGKCRQCENILSVRRENLRDHRSECRYVNEGISSHNWTSSMVTQTPHLWRNNEDHNHLLLGCFAKTRTEAAKRPILQQNISLCIEERSLLTLFLTGEKTVFNDSQMKELGWNGRISDEDCETWMSITARTRLLSQRGKPQQPHITPVPRKQVATATCSRRRRDRLNYG